VSELKEYDLYGHRKKELREHGRARRCNLMKWEIVRERP